MLRTRELETTLQASAAGAAEGAETPADRAGEVAAGAPLSRGHRRDRAAVAPADRIQRLRHRTLVAVLLAVGAVGSVCGEGQNCIGLRGITGGLREDSPPLVDRLAQLQRARAEAAVAATGTMAREGEYEFEWDVWAYNDAIKKSAALEDCTALLRRMQVAEVTPNAVTFHGILECALRGTKADAKAACDIFERIPRAQRNHHTYACAIRLYAILDCGAQTVRLLAEGKEHNIAPDADMIAASMEAQMATASRRDDVEDGGLAGSGATGSRRSAGGAGGRRMSKAERRKAKRRSERADDTEEEDDHSSCGLGGGGGGGGGWVGGDGGAGGGEGGCGDGHDSKVAGEPSAHASAGIATSSGAAGTSGGAERGGVRTDVELPTETDLPDLYAGGNGGEDVEFDDEIAGPAPLRENDIDWGSGPQRGPAGADQKPTMVFEIPKGQVSAGRLDQYLSENIPFLSRSAITKMIKEGYVTLSSASGGGGDRVAKPAAKTKAGDVVNVYLPAPATCADILSDAIPLQILYEDAALVVLNKQAGLTVHPCAGVPRGTMVNALAHHFTTPGFNASPQAGTGGGGGGGGGLSSVGAGGARPGIVHRLDRFTSGCIIVAKSDLAHWRLADDFAQHQVLTRYLPHCANLNPEP
jgi:23S rRNA-/tRNA-specific pseudouridylate synthase